MTTDADLARWGEPPTSPEEETLAQFLHEVLQTLRQPKAGPAPKPPPGGQELLRTITWVQELASSVWDHAGLAAAAGPDLPDPFPGEFRVVRLLGEGAFGQVWLADDLNVGRQVALKVLKPLRAADKGALEALRNEARLLGSLRHPNVVQVYAVRQSGGDHYLVLQYVRGGSLADRLQKTGPLPWQQAARVVADVGEALSHVHTRGIVHRDVNPANILWDPEGGEAVLTDFGVSCRLADPSTAAGTVPYLAPEALDGRVGPALDVFSLAATLFRLATGVVPFPADDIVTHVGKVLDGLPDPDPRSSVLPPDLERLVRTALAADPEGRPDLPQFVGMLRGTLNRLLVDTVILPAIAAPGSPPVDLRLVVNRDVGDATFQSLRTVKPVRSSSTRDLKRVPPEPEQVRLRTGDRVRIQVRADRAGYVTVFNVGPTGNLHLLCPEDVTVPPPRLEPGRPLDVLEVEVTPPPGRERLVAAWTREPLPPARVLRLTGQGSGDVSRPYRATRDLERVQESVRRLPREDWHAVVLELDHED
jgi:serine/threonine protein kinase